MLEKKKRSLAEDGDSIHNVLPTHKIMWLIIVFVANFSVLFSQLSPPSFA
jgi:hypothetical protein